MNTQRILSGWNFKRFLFLGLGILYLTASIADHIWFGVVLSLAFIIQSILGIGCCGGNCYDGQCENPTTHE